MSMPLGEHIMQWIKLHTTELFQGDKPLLLLPANKKACSECKGIRVLGKGKGLAYCRLLNRALQNSEHAKGTHLCMDKRVTQGLCLKEGMGCPIVKMEVLK